MRGCDKVLFASDYPLLDLETTVRAARDMELEDEALERVLRLNAERRLWS